MRRSSTNASPNLALHRTRSRPRFLRVHSLLTRAGLVSLIVRQHASVTSTEATSDQPTSVCRTDALFRLSSGLGGGGRSIRNVQPPCDRASADRSHGSFDLLSFADAERAATMKHLAPTRCIQRYADVAKKPVWFGRLFNAGDAPREIERYRPGVDAIEQILSRRFTRLVFLPRVSYRQASQVDGSLVPNTTLSARQVSALARS